MNWINPETHLPEEKERLLFKTKVLHTERIRYGYFEDGSFHTQEVPRESHEAKQVWGWQEFTDSKKRDG